MVLSCRVCDGWLARQGIFRIFCHSHTHPICMNGYKTTYYLIWLFINLQISFMRGLIGKKDAWRPMQWSMTWENDLGSSNAFLWIYSHTNGKNVFHIKLYIKILWAYWLKQYRFGYVYQRSTLRNTTFHIVIY